MNILIVTWRDLAHPLAGGSEVFVDRLAEGLLLKGNHVVVVCGRPTTTHRYPVVDGGGTYTQYLRAPIVCKKKFADFDLVVDVENGIPFFSPLWWRNAIICLVHHVHTEQWRDRFPLPIATLAAKVESKVMPLVYRKTMMVAVSDSTKQALIDIGIEPSCIRVVHNGVDIPAIVYSKSQEPQFLVLGRLVPHKRVDLILNVWEQVRPVVGGKLIIAGEGPEMEHLKSTATAGVELLGRVDQTTKERLLQESWFLVHAAHHEGWGLVIMEAAAAGTPSLAITAPGVQDAVIDGVTGVLAPDADHMAREWILLAKEEGRRMELGTNAALRAK